MNNEPIRFTLHEIAQIPHLTRYILSPAGRIHNFAFFLFKLTDWSVWVNYAKQSQFPKTQARLMILFKSLFLVRTQIDSFSTPCHIILFCVFVERYRILMPACFSTLYYLQNKFKSVVISVAQYLPR